MAQASGTFNRSVLIAKSNTVNFDGSTYAANAATKAIPADAIFVGGAGVEKKLSQVATVSGTLIA